MSMKFILLIKVKMPTIVGILTFMSRINDWLDNFTQKIPSILRHSGYFSIYEQKRIITSGTWISSIVLLAGLDLFSIKSQL